jgi:abequosyltransferase
MMVDSVRPVLSICIATFNRAKYIGVTLDALLVGLPGGVEVVIVDGASTDDTQRVIESYTCRTSAVRYIRESTNSGIDKDFDKAVGFARGDFCWLMSDDDVLMPGSIERVLATLEPSLDLVIVNAKIRNADLRIELNPRIVKITADRVYDRNSSDEFLAEVGDYLSFIGGVVIRRDRWLERERERYFGTLFIHVGVILQAPVLRVKIIADPLITIRYGNAMWTSRGFEIWMFKWPDLIWSFDNYSQEAKSEVVAREPWKQWRRLMFSRATGAYSYSDYQNLFKNRGLGGWLQFVVSLVPAAVANSVTALYWFATKPDARTGIYDLARSRYAGRLTRLVARRLNIPLR